MFVLIQQNVNILDNYLAFLFGKRKRSTPWDDYIVLDEENVDY